MYVKYRCNYTSVSIYVNTASTTICIIWVWKWKVKLWVAQSCMTLWSHGCSLPGDLGLIPELGRFPGEGKGYPLQYSGLEISMDCTSMGSLRVGHNWATSTFKLSVTFVSLSSGSRSSSIFYYEVGRNHIKAQNQIPFQIQIGNMWLTENEPLPKRLQPRRELQCFPVFTLCDTCRRHQGFFQWSQSFNVAKPPSGNAVAEHKNILK